MRHEQTGTVPIHIPVPIPSVSLVEYFHPVKLSFVEYLLKWCSETSSQLHTSLSLFNKYIQQLESMSYDNRESTPSIQQLESMSYDNRESTPSTHHHFP